MIKETIILITLIIAVVLGAYYYTYVTPYQNITNFEECASAGYPVMESYPEQCRTPDGRTFVKILGFCGTSTNATCSNSTECMTGGCSGQVCQGVNEEPIITICLYRDCYNNEAYNYTCGCSYGHCAWIKE